MKLTDLLKGKMVKIMTDAKVEVELEIESVEEERHSRDLEPSTRENDWWPASESWTTIRVKFVNWYVKSYGDFGQINIVE
jgi:hypothetical protein